MLYMMLSWYDDLVFFFKQKTAYDMRISDWSSDVCSSDLALNTSTTVVSVASQGGSRPPPGRNRGWGKIKSSHSHIAALSTDGPGLPLTTHLTASSEERRVGKSVSVRVDLGGRRIIKKKKHKHIDKRRYKKTRLNQR